MVSELLYLSHCMVLEAPQSARDIAQAVGKPYSTLFREVNPYDTGAKLGVETLLELMRVTGNLAPLRYMAQELGCTLNEHPEQIAQKSAVQVTDTGPAQLSGISV